MNDSKEFLRIYHDVIGTIHSMGMLIGVIRRKISTSRSHLVQDSATVLGPQLPGGSCYPSSLPKRKKFRMLMAWGIYSNGREGHLLVQKISNDGRWWEWRAGYQGHLWSFQVSPREGIILINSPWSREWPLPLEGQRFDLVIGSELTGGREYLEDPS